MLPRLALWTSSKLQRFFMCRYLPSLRKMSKQTSSKGDGVPEMAEYDAEKIRNFSIIAHVDHGKSTLADRLLEYTNTIEHSTSNKQVLDKLQVERERGITVKAQTSSMFFKVGSSNMLFNLIDTPGHVDFSYEVSRSLAACQGALLIVDAAQGIQAQTVAHYFKALEHNLKIIPVINKIDLSNANVEKVSQQIENILDLPRDDILKVSAKEGIGIENILKSITENIPSPVADLKNDLALFLFDSWYDKYRGVICLVAVKDGVVRKGDRVQSHHSKDVYDVIDIGILHPDEKPTGTLYPGQVGYISMGMRDVKQALIGDTFYHENKPVTAALGFKTPTPMVFAGVFPTDQSMYMELKRAIEKLILNDSSVSVHPDNSAALGQGWRVGFLGLLHMDVFKQRLAQEYNTEVIMTTPNVPYKAMLRSMKEIEIKNPEDFPQSSSVEDYYEPMVRGTLIFPEQYIGKVINLCENKRGEQKMINYVDDTRILMKYELPLNEIVVDFYDELKSLTSGYASFDYEESGYKATNIDKMEILLNGKAVDTLSTIVHRTKVRDVGKSYCYKLKNNIPRQLFEIVIQAVVRGKVIARETIKPIRKDVTAKCYGGDITRKRKLLERQKEGKKRMKRFGNVDVPYEAFLTLLKR